jgi:hypothetical protein
MIERLEMLKITVNTARSTYDLSVRTEVGRKSTTKCIRHRRHRKRRIQKLFYCCVCICWRDNGFTEPLPSNDTRDTQTDGRDL